MGVSHSFIHSFSQTIIRQHLLCARPGAGLWDQEVVETLILFALFGLMVPWEGGGTTVAASLDTAGLAWEAGMCKSTVNSHPACDVGRCHAIPLDSTLGWHEPHPLPTSDDSDGMSVSSPLHTLGLDTAGLCQSTATPQMLL